MLEQRAGGFKNPSSPRFIGLDLAWSDRNPSGAALALVGTGGVSVVEIAYLQSNRQIVEWISERAPGPALVAIDAPIIAPNPTGKAREVDGLMTRLFGRYHAGVYPANRERCARPIRLRRALERRGFSPDPTLAPGERVRRQIEFYPHSSLVALLDLPRILKYKKGPVNSRRQGLKTLQKAIHRLERLEPTLQRSPPLEDLLAISPWDRAGSGLKELEDLLDAVVLAYLGAYYWFWGLDRCMVLGDRRRGYIVTAGRRRDHPLESSNG